MLSSHRISISSHIFMDYFIWVISLSEGDLHNILSHEASYNILHNMYTLPWHAYKYSDLIRVQSIYHGLQKAWLFACVPRQIYLQVPRPQLLEIDPLTPPSSPSFKAPSSLDRPNCSPCFCPCSPTAYFHLTENRWFPSKLKSDHVTSLHPSTQPFLARVYLRVKVLQWPWDTVRAASLLFLGLHLTIH